MVDWINSLGNIKWCSLMTIAERYLRTKATIGESARPTASGPYFNTKVALRRYLSEVRDNHVETNSFFTNFYKMMRS
jgi:hypothetical protein